MTIIIRDSCSNIIEVEIIEGIGSRTGVLEELTAFESGSHLCALYIDTTLIFPEYQCNLSATDTCLTLNVESKFNDSESSVFPNPANDQFQIKISNDLLLYSPKLDIISNLGETCISLTLTNNITKININELHSGFYIIRIYTDKKLISRKKLIIEK